jgi:hypothetical protein
MLFGVLRMPYKMAMDSELSRFQFYQRAQEAADRLEAAEGYAPLAAPAPTELMNIVAFEMHMPAGGEGRESPEVLIVFKRSEATELVEEGWKLEREMWSNKSTRPYVPQIASQPVAALPAEQVPTAMTYTNGLAMPYSLGNRLPGIPAPTKQAVELPPLPELDTLADIKYAHTWPDDWDADYRSIWQKLQVAERNNMQWRVYAMDLRAALAARQSPTFDMKAAVKAAFDIVTDEAIQDDETDDQYHAGKLAGILALKRALEALPAARQVVAPDAAKELPKWIDNLKGSDPTIDDLIAYIEGIDGAVERDAKGDAK